jgi:integrase
MTKNKRDNLIHWRSENPVRDDMSKNSTLISKSIKVSTARQYQTPVSYFEAISSFPVTKTNIVTFVRALLENGFLAPTIRKYVSAIKTTNINKGFKPLTTEGDLLLSRALMAADRLAPQDVVKKASILQQSMVKSLINLVIAQDSREDQVRSVVLLSICCLLRLCEPFKLQWKDVTVDSVNLEGKILVSLILRDTKTKNSECVELECQHSCRLNWCPVHYLKRRKLTARSDNDRVFTELTQQTTCSKLRLLCQKEFPNLYSEWNLEEISGHSFRRTGANVLYKNGKSPDLIMAQGRWASQVWSEYTVEAVKLETRKLPTSICNKITNQQ